MLRGYDRGLQFVFRHQFVDADVDARADRGDRLSLRHTSPRASFREQDTGFIFGQAEARQDTSFAAMAKLEHEFADIVLTGPGGRRRRWISPAPTGGNPTENTARLFIQLKPLDRARSIGSDRSSSACAPRWRRSIGAKFFMQAGQDISVGGRLSRDRSTNTR